MRKGRPNDLERDLAATALVEAAFNPDEEVCRRYGISRRTLQRYRRQLPMDRLLAGAVARKKAALDRAWAEQLPDALIQGLRTIRSMFDAMADDPVQRSNPLALHAVVQAFAALVEIHLTMQALELRLGKKL
jgi:hypothetical protein